MPNQIGSETNCPIVSDVQMYEMCKCHQLCTFRERRFQFRHRCLHCHQVCESGRQSGRHRKESRQSEDSGQPMPISDDQRSKCLLILSIIVIQKKTFQTTGPRSDRRFNFERRYSKVVRYHNLRVWKTRCFGQ